MKPKITAVLIMARERRSHLQEQLEASGVEVVPASSSSEARRALAAQPIQVVLTDAELPGGDWRCVLEDVRRNRVNAEVIVCARLADAMLWCDALEAGAYDLLVEPYYPEEVRRIVEAAAAKSFLDAISRQEMAEKTNVAPKHAVA